MIKIILAISVALLILGVLCEHYYYKSNMHIRIAKKRRLMRVGEIKNKFYPDSNISEETFDSLWNDIAESFEIPAGLIRPDDIFGKEIPFKGSLSDEDLFLSEALYRRMQEFGIEEPIPAMERVDDYIRFLTSSMK